MCYHVADPRARQEIWQLMRDLQSTQVTLEVQASQLRAQAGLAAQIQILPVSQLAKLPVRVLHRHHLALQSTQAGLLVLVPATQNQMRVASQLTKP